MNENELKLFHQIVSLSQPRLKEALSKILKSHYSTVIETKDYLIAEGNDDTPIALVAHLDTVFNETPTNIYHDAKTEVLWSPEGLGADDRAGVFIILSLIRKGYRPHIIFTTEEERGGIGASALATIRCPFKKLNYIIELDRQGKDDCVFYECDNVKFIKYVESFGFKKQEGTFTDISFLCPAWKIAGVNLSVGYYLEHSYAEYLKIRELKATMHKVENMLKAKDMPYFEYIPKKYKYKKVKKWLNKCVKCGSPVNFMDAILLTISKEASGYFCDECFTSECHNIECCSICGNFYLTIEEKEDCCPKCQEKLEEKMNV